MKIAVIAWAILIIVIGGMFWDAFAHDWYPNECCHDRDCYHAPKGAVVETDEGYLVHGQLIPYGNPRIKHEGSTDGYHICQYYQETWRPIICLFTPPPQI